MSRLGDDRSGSIEWGSPSWLDTVCVRTDAKIVGLSEPGRAGMEGSCAVAVRSLSLGGRGVKPACESCVHLAGLGFEARDEGVLAFRIGRLSARCGCCRSKGGIAAVPAPPTYGAASADPPPPRNPYPPEAEAEAVRGLALEPAAWF